MSDALSIIRARRNEIAAAIADLEDEDKDLGTAELVLARLAGGVSAPKPPGASSLKTASAPPSANEAKVRPSSQRGMVMEVLRDSGEAWLASGDLIAEVQKLWGAQVPEMSLRPLLSTMKRERVIVRDGHRIALRERVESGSRRAPAHASN
jgi:hypothetical protein